MSETHDTLPPADSAPTAPPLPLAANTTSRGSWLAITALLLSAGLGAVVWQQQATLRVLTADQETLADTKATLAALQAEELAQQAVLDAQKMQVDTALAELRATQQQAAGAQQQAQLDLQQRLQSALARLDAQSSELAGVEQRVDKVTALLGDGGQAALRAQQLAEAAGMLRLAELRLQVARDIGVAETLVRSADAVLARRGDPAVAPARAALANDLVAIQAARDVDSTLLHQQLARIMTAQQALRASAALVDDAYAVEPAATPPPSTSASWLQRFGRWLSQYFVVTKRTEAVAPLLTPEQEWLIHQRIALQLQQAQIAALNGEQALFQQAIADASASITANLQGEGKAALVAELDALQQTVLRPALPTLAASLAAIEQLQESATGTTP